MTAKAFLDQVYTLETPEETKLLYDAWADSYETELMRNGYALPARAARALAAWTTDLDAPVLDYGCGTGLSGVALLQAGFNIIDGADLSAEMLQVAREKGLYRKLWQVDPEIPSGVRPGDYAAITAIGVIGAGAAPIDLFDTLMDTLEPGGLFLFSFNDPTLKDPAYDGKLHDHVDRGNARLLFQEYGEHLPELNMKSYVYIIEKK